MVKDGTLLTEVVADTLLDHPVMEEKLIKLQVISLVKVKMLLVLVTETVMAAVAVAFMEDMSHLHPAVQQNMAVEVQDILVI